jgi:Na+-transporting methylmalonyl-CoA/oxaloacetate decarboxylase gamma subunit
MLLALWIVVSRMLIIFAVLGVLFLAIILLNKLVGPKEKEEKKDKQ